ncbi:MAG: diaminopimelate decarboxylase [Clostridia bacterium]|nr:diaminopimelate decarboxylase [Clostridia bacterium]
MFVSDCLNINANGHLTIGNVDTMELAKQYGTPVYVIDEQAVRNNCKAFVSSMKENYGENGLVLYASKAFCCKEMCRICNEEGMGLDVVSGGELYTAISAGFPTEKICFHGNNKTVQELTMAVENGVGRIVVDNIEELGRLDSICKEKNLKANILLRIKPGVEAHTHEFIRTGQIDSKFGFAIETGEALDAVKKAIATENINITGLHCHIGSQIFDIDPFVFAAKVMLDFMALVKKETGTELKELNLGGGFGIKYLSTENPPAFFDYMNTVAGKVKEYAKELGLNSPFIFIEPGRSIVGAAGITLYTVGSVKEIPNIRTYVAIDGGMFDNPRYILYQSKYEIMCANKANEPKDMCVTVAGKCCESGDLIGEHTMIQQVEPGDILAVLSTGAYNFSMASNYNRNGRPPVVMVNNGESRIIVKGDSYEDLVRNDI